MTKHQSRRHGEHGRLTPLAYALKLALMGAAISGGVAKAQETAPEGTLPTIIVTGTTEADGKASAGYRSKQSSIGGFAKQDILDTPFSVKVIPAELLLNQDVNTIAKLDRFDASVSSSSSNPSWFSSPMIRGFSLDNWSNYRYNGQIMVNQQATGLENKERVEILKGLSALQGGFSAPGGLINYVTKRPSLQSINDVHFSVNQFGNAKVHVDLSRRNEDGRLRVRINAAVEEQQSYVRQVEGKREFASVAFDWKLTPSTMFQLDVERERNNLTLQPNLRTTATDRLPANIDPRRFLGQTWASFPTESTLISSKLEHFVNDHWSLIAEANWMRLDRSQDSVGLFAIQPNGNASARVSFFPNQKREPSNIRLMAQGKVDTGPVGHDLTFGVQSHQFRRHEGSGSGTITQGPTNIYNPVQYAEPTVPPIQQHLVQRSSEDSLFAQDVLSFGEAWKLHLGGRYAVRKQANFNAGTGATIPNQQYDKNVFSPSAALVFKPRPDVSTYISYVEGLEQGGIAPAGTSNQFRELDPKTSEQVEVGVKAEFAAGFTGEASLFRIERPAEYTNSANTFVQDGLQRNQGLELSLTGKLTNEWTLMTSAMLLDAKLKDTGDVTTQGKRAQNTPTHRLALVTEYSPKALAGWAFSGNWSRVSRRQTSDTNITEAAPSYDVIGLGARYDTRFSSTPVTFRVNVDNLLDKFYWDGAQQFSLVPGAPRTVSASVSLRF